MKVNPRLQKNGLLLLGAAVAGPALVVAGARYPGSWSMKALLMLTGVGVSGASYHYLREDIAGYLTGPTENKP